MQQNTTFINLQGATLRRVCESRAHSSWLFSSSKGWYTEQALSVRFINAKAFPEICAADTKVKLTG